MTCTLPTGNLPTLVSPDNIVASVPSKIAFATSLTSARVGLAASTMLCSICVATIAGLPATAPLDQVLLDQRHAGQIHLDAQVAAGDHQAVRLGDDLVDLIDRLRLLDLGDDADVTLPALQPLAKLPNVGRASNERQRQVIEVVLDRPVDARPVTVGDARQPELRVRQVHALARLDDAPGSAAEPDAVRLLAGADEAEQPVLDEDAVAHFDVVDQALVRDADHAVSAQDVVALDDQLVANGDRHAARVVGFVDVADANLGAAQVTQDGDAAIELVGFLANLGEHLAVSVQLAVAEVEPADINAGRQQGLQVPRLRHGRPHGGDDLRTDERLWPRLGACHAADATGPAEPRHQSAKLFEPTAQSHPRSVTLNAAEGPRLNGVFADEVLRLASLAQDDGRGKGMT